MALFKTTKEFKTYIKVDANMRFQEGLLPYIEDATELFLEDILGKAFLDHLESAYQASTLTAEEQLLLPLVQRTLANYAMHQFMAQGAGVSFGDKGVQQQRGEFSDPSPQWKEKSLIKTTLKKADQYADKLLEYLENTSSPTVFQLWHLTDADPRLEGFLVYNTDTFNQEVDISGSRRLFLKLKRYIRQVEQRNVQNLVCSDQYQELVAQRKAGTLTAANQALVDQLVPIICRQAMVLALPSLRILSSEDGIQTISSADGIDSRALAGDKEVKNLIDVLEGGPFGYKEKVQEIQEFIATNIGDYPLIEVSPCYTSRPTETKKHLFENNQENKHFHP
jgi:hypothetical protein